jgi:hypothetical protein
MYPLRAHLKHYRGAKPDLRRKVNEHNRQAERVADHINRLIANNPAEIQQYYFRNIAIDLGIPFEVVRSAISTGGANGITLGVRPTDRPALAAFVDPSLAEQSV